MTLNLCEQILRNAGAETIITTYRIDHDAAKLFAKKHRYIRSFSSTYMKYDGDKFDIPFLSIQEYNDEDVFEHLSIEEDIGTGKNIYRFYTIYYPRMVASK